MLVEFFSVSDYLHLLLNLSFLLGPFHQSVLLYLSAAVSDFYLPDDQVSEHKIQSGRNDLILTLKPVPKMLKILKASLCPEAFIVSFKLETDENLVIKKAQESLDKSGHDLVVSNCLATRKEKVLLVDKEIVETIELKDKTRFIEELLVSKIVQRHLNHYKNE